MKKTDKELDRKVIFNIDEYFLLLVRYDNLQYIKWALMNVDIELQIYKHYQGRRKELYPQLRTTKNNNEKKDTFSNNILEIADLALSLTSPVGAMKYIVKKAKERS
ncbi:hypothetical protein [Peribacillus frigoritolerans]|uniref:hypothetical protein n=1 Tax=Peribacillus frigoritolerans TaxID=450367 RepID=UPI003305EDBA